MINSEISEPLLWQRLLSFGNECYKKENWLQAEYYFKEAESQLDFLWALDLENIHLLMAWITSLHNLSKVYELQGDEQLALRHLLIPHYRVLEVTQDENSSEDMKLIAINALNLTFKPILSFTQKYPVCESCVEGLKSFKENLDKHRNVEH